MRLFVAIDLPWSVRRQLAALATGIPGARWVGEDQLHLTLRFIGEVPPWRAEEIDLALHGLRGRGFTFSLAGAGLFERAGRVTTLYAGVERSPPLELLQSKVETALQRAGLDPERRRFVPHVTLARMDLPVTEKITGFIQRNNLFRSEPLVIDRVTLFSSQLAYEAPIYTAEADYPLS
jgi:2'-5' RNA ligase